MSSKGDDDDGDDGDDDDVYGCEAAFANYTRQCLCKSKFTLILNYKHRNQVRARPSISTAVIGEAWPTTAGSKINGNYVGGGDHEDDHFVINVGRRNQDD